LQSRLKKQFSVCVFGLFGHVYITTRCFGMFWQVCQNIGWRQRPVGDQKSSRFRGAKLHWTQMDSRL